MAGLTRELIGKAFDRLGCLAADSGKVIDLAVYGGSCLLLVSNIRDVTRDVDAVFLTERDHGYRFADIVQQQFGLPDNWLNQAVKQFAPPKGNPEPNLLPFGEYPGEGVVGLRVFVPTPEYLLAMKLLANRGDDFDAVNRDKRDIHHLMRLTGLHGKAQLDDLIKTCFPAVLPS